MSGESQSNMIHISQSVSRLPAAVPIPLGVRWDSGISCSSFIAT